MSVPAIGASSSAESAPAGTATTGSGAAGIGTHSPAQRAQRTPCPGLSNVSGTS
jgi:hypothetical protein